MFAYNSPPNDISHEIDKSNLAFNNTVTLSLSAKIRLQYNNENASIRSKIKKGLG